MIFYDIFTPGCVCDFIKYSFWNQLKISSETCRNWCCPRLIVWISFVPSILQLKITYIYRLMYKLPVANWKFAFVAFYRRDSASMIRALNIFSVHCLFFNLIIKNDYFKPCKTPSGWILSLLNRLSRYQLIKNNSF